MRWAFALGLWACSGIAGFLAGMHWADSNPPRTY